MPDTFFKIRNSSLEITSRQSGFTIFEVIVTAAIAAVIVLAVGKFSDTISGVGTLLHNKLQTSQDLEQVFQTVVIEIRSISQSSLGGYPIESASTSSLVFFSDINRDGSFERVRYFLATSTLRKGVVTPAGNPLAYVTSTEIVTSVIPNIVPGGNLFSYYGSVATSTMTPLPSPIDVAAIRIVKMSLTADVSTSTSPRPTTMDATITIRNLRSN
jgi:prepilin-type N-terminal cleavage/methylation domain-containing protein